VILIGARPGEFRTKDPFVCALSPTKSLMVPQMAANVAAVAVGVALGLAMGLAEAATVAKGVGDAVLTGAAVQATTSTRNGMTRTDLTPRLCGAGAARLGRGDADRTGQGPDEGLRALGRGVALRVRLEVTHERVHPDDHRDA